MTTEKLSQLFNKVDQQELDVCLRLNRTAAIPAVHAYFATVSKLGDGGFWYLIILMLPLIAGQHGLALALSMTGTGLCCTLIYKLLKRWLVRERPFISFKEIVVGTHPLDRYSFPSGHTLHAVCFTVMLAVGAPELLTIVIPFTLSVMLSRVVLGLHYPSDVLAGALIGASLGALSLAILPIDALLALLSHTH